MSLGFSLVTPRVAQTWEAAMDTPPFPMFLIVLASREQHLSAGTGHTLGVGIDYISTLLPRPCLMAIAWFPVCRDTVLHIPPLRGEPLDVDHHSSSGSVIHATSW